MVVIAETEAGTVCFCGDRLQRQAPVDEPDHAANDVIVTSNHVVSRRSEKIALKRLMQTAPRFYLYPSHDWPVLVEEGRVTEGGERTLRATMGRCFCSIGESSP